MKFTIFILSSFLFFFMTQPNFAQLHIDAEGNGGLGIATSSDARFKILNSTEQYGLKIEQNANINATKYGLSLDVNELGEGEKRGVFSYVRQQSAGSTNYKAYGFYSDIANYGNQPTYGFHASLVNAGTGSKLGFSSSIGQPAASTQQVRGIVNSIYQYGSGDTRGISTEVTILGTAQGYGEFLNVNGSGPGYNYVWGLYSNVYGDATSIQTGVYATVQPGIYNKAGDFNGDVYVSGQIISASDEKLKENIQDLQGALALVGQIKPKKYKYKNLPNHGNDPKLQQYGFLAQDLQTVLPDLVKPVKHRGRTRPKSNNGNGGGNGNGNGNGGNGNGNGPSETEWEQLEPDEDILTINYTSLIPILTQAIKEQQAIIEDLEKRLEKVEKK